LAAYNYVLNAFKAINVQVVALSVDLVAESQKLCARLGLELPVVSELSYPSSVDAVGAYRNESRESHQATAFVLDRNRIVEHAVYSTTNIGRLMPDEALRVLS
jgi:peroxiredoxin